MAVTSERTIAIYKYNNDYNNNNDYYYYYNIKNKFHCMLEVINVTIILFRQCTELNGWVNYICVSTFRPMIC